MSSAVIQRRISALPNALEPLNEEQYPVMNASDYLDRINALLELGKGLYSHYVIYGDREHFSNVEYLTGYDPRFEECLLIVSENQKPTIVVGNEGPAYAGRIPYPVNIVIYPTFSLPAQPQNHNVTLREIFKQAGIDRTAKVGVIGWKMFYKKVFENYRRCYDLPMFIMQELLQATDADCLTNATDLMIDNCYGIRHRLSAKELILCEIAGTKSSRSTYRVLQNLEEGISELKASSFLHIDGDPIIAHPNINFGENNFYALASPTHTRKLKVGDLVGVGMAYRRSLCHKVSYYVEDESQYNPDIAEDIRYIYRTYFSAVTAWYQEICEGATGGQVYAAVKKVVGNLEAFGIGLNPGHTIHTDEWTNSPFAENSDEILHSGMAIQCDFTAAFPTKGISVHAEDGIIIANRAMQEEIRKISPDSFKRMQTRRDFMNNILGIHLAPDVLPTSDMPAVIFPYLRDLRTVLANDVSY